MKPYNKEASDLLDYALHKSESGSSLWAWIKSVIESWIFS
jgi:hypothetical protein